MSVGLGAGLIALLILLEGFFSGSELALVSADRLRIRAQRDSSPSMRKLAEFLAEPERILTTTLIGTNACLVSTTTLMALLLRQGGVAEDRAALLTVVALTPLVLLFAELIPKSIFRRYANRIAPVVIHPLGWLSTALTPAVALVRWITGGLMALVGAESRPGMGVSRDELRLLLDAGEGEGFEADEAEMIHRIFDFREVTVKEVMRPLIDVVAIDESATLAEALEKLLDSGHSRLPVYRERVDDLVAVLHARDVLEVDELDRRVDGLMRPISYVPVTQKVELLLGELQKERLGMAVVVDEYGGAEGIITVEDILEEIVGEIEDEHDPQQTALRRRGALDFLVSARIEVDRLNEQLGLKLPEGDYETLAGFLLQAFGRIPPEGAVHEVDGAWLTVASATRRAIEEVAVRLREPPPDETLPGG